MILRTVGGLYLAERSRQMKTNQIKPRFPGGEATVTFTRLMPSSEAMSATDVLCSRCGESVPPPPPGCAHAPRWDQFAFGTDDSRMSPELMNRICRARPGRSSVSGKIVRLALRKFRQIQ